MSDPRLTNCLLTATAAVLGIPVPALINELDEFHADGAVPGAWWGDGDGSAVPSASVDLYLQARLGWRYAAPAEPGRTPFPLPSTGVIHVVGHAFGIRDGMLFDTASGNHHGTIILSVMCPRDLWEATYAEAARRGWLISKPPQKATDQ